MSEGHKHRWRWKSQVSTSRPICNERKVESGKVDTKCLVRFFSPQKVEDNIFKVCLHGSDSE